MRMRIVACRRIVAAAVLMLSMAIAVCAAPAWGASLDPETETNVANALWMLNFDPAHIPHEVAMRLASPINANMAFGSRFKTGLMDLIEDPMSFTPDYSMYYANLASLSASISPRQ